MSNYTITLKHKKSGEMHEILALDNYFEHHEYGYKTPTGAVWDKDGLLVFYEPVSPQTAGEEA